MLAHAFDYLRNKSGRIWHCRIPLAAMKGAAYYAYRVGGPLPAGRFEWHAFDRDKALLDPYARSVFFPPSLDRLAASRPGSNAGKAPLGVIAGDHGRSGRKGPRRPRHEATAVIYEVHVGGFTRHPSSGMTPEVRGTYAGVIDKIPYLGGMALRGSDPVHKVPIIPRGIRALGCIIQRPTEAGHGKHRRAQLASATHQSGVPKAA